MKVQSLNLHGLSLEEARQKTRQNLSWCMQNGVDVLDLNHGKGFHSSRNFSVLKQELRRMLKSEPALKEFDYKVVYGESDLPVALAYDEGHTLIVARGKEKEYIGGRKELEKKQRIFSPEGRQERRLRKKRSK
ncbi:MAG: Smr/MutS family protein [Syntrophomonas sp.]|uniref:Smr/MutS family protein n=1 Tax=Syntrophomonas sp. TaxID=2053627 RepID=UPI002607D9BE|nr:Smr/MutS family protein [Syntrophomonas sp.]MDD2510093.1 Smr/MutS family protein [Syntrophomonas sp.]MDD3878726.1 Smr/MutS family protein [Syntrophomonas sp.]MDD4626951.1 Smr/MutS family protein [Syntrophomonas sp.]